MTAGTRTRSASASGSAACAGHQQQQQEAPSAKDGGSASATHQSEPRRKQAGSAGGRRFTPDQQAVATALMVVMKRAMMGGGREGIIAAWHTLVTNNSATKPMLRMLLEEGAPTLSVVEQCASTELHESLSTLARQCEAASCQPLEVFTRSMQCTRRQADIQVMHFEKWAHLGTQDAQWCRKTVGALQQLGAQRSMAELIVAYLQVLTLPRDDAKQLGARAEFCLEDLLPGKVTHS